jgi:hypothetical protein
MCHGLRGHERKTVARLGLIYEFQTTFLNSKRATVSRTTLRKPWHADQCYSYLHCNETQELFALFILTEPLNPSIFYKRFSFKHITNYIQILNSSVPIFMYQFEILNLLIIHQYNLPILFFEFETYS